MLMVGNNTQVLVANMKCVHNGGLKVPSSFSFLKNSDYLISILSLVVYFFFIQDRTMSFKSICFFFMSKPNDLFIKASNVDKSSTELCNEQP